MINIKSYVCKRGYKMTMKKISKNIYEVQKIGKMLVPM